MACQGIIRKNIGDTMEITSVDFWMNLLTQWKELGTIAPFLLSMLESFIPALPLAAIIAFNVTTHGTLLGFLLSYGGTLVGAIIVFLFTRRVLKPWLSKYILKHKKIENLLIWVANSNKVMLFLLTAIPFTPSSFINIGYGLSDFKEKDFVITITISKAIMTLALTFFGNFLSKTLENPWFIIPAILILIVLYCLARWIKSKVGFKD